MTRGALEPRSEWAIREIVAATDLSDCSRNALDHAIALARATEARLTVVHVHEGPDYDDNYRSAVYGPGAPPRYSGLHADRLDLSAAPELDVEAAAALDRTHFQQLEGLPRVHQMGVAGEAVESILDVAQRTGGLVVVGSHGRRAVARAILGSTADAVIRRSTVPVLAVPCGVPRNDDGVVVAILDEPEVADDVLHRAATLAAAWRTQVVVLRVANDGEVDRNQELATAMMAVIAFPLSKSDANVRALLRSRLCPVLAIPVRA